MSLSKTKLPDKFIQFLAPWFALFGVVISSSFVLIGLVYVFKANDFALLKTLVLDQTRVVIGVPFALLNSYCLVLFLEATSGPIEFEALGFKFKGASGPLVLWIFVFLALISGIKFLWQ